MQSFRTKLRRLAKNRNIADPQIGYRLLADPFFFDESDRLSVSRDIFPGPIVTGKGFDSSEPVGRQLLEQVRGRMPFARVAEAEQPAADPLVARPARLGQVAFRLAVQENYQRCIVSTEHTLPVLEAAHITPYSQEPSHELSNGLLLRRDIHRLFDLGLVTITPDLQFKVSDELRETYSNGKVYYDMQRKLQLPEGALPPDPARLERHATEVYKGSL